MLGYPADKALIYGLMWSVSGCLSLCLGSMATGSCSQHKGGLLDNIFEKMSLSKM